jgi:hypothetical protein
MTKQGGVLRRPDIKDEQQQTRPCFPPLSWQKNPKVGVNPV